MGLSQKQVFDVIFIDRLHALDSLTAAVLVLEIVDAHALDVAKLGHRHDGILIRNQILHGHIKLVKANGSLTVIAVLVRDHKDFLADHA